MSEVIDIPKEHKSTKIGVFPNNWQLVKANEIGDFSSGTTPSRQKHSDYFLNGTIPWVKTTDLNNGEIIVTEELVTEKALKDTSLKLLPENTVLVAMYGGFKQIGRTGILKNKATINQALTAITLKDDYNPKFILEWFNYRIGYWRNFAGSSRKDPNITGKDVKDFPIIAPPLPEQQKIAEILSTWDQAISTTQSLIEELKLRNKGLAQQLLTGKKRLKGFEGEWREVTLKDIAERVIRKNEELDDTVVTISAQRGFVLQEDFFTKRVASETLSNYYLIHNGEFAYNKSYSNGYPMGAFKRLDDFEKAVVTTLYICFSLKKNVNSDFMNHLFEAGLMIRPLMKIAQEGGRAHGLLNIGIHDFFGLKLAIPPVEEQKAINSVLSEAEKELKLYQQQLDTLKEQKKGLMQKLLTGEIRVKTD